MHTEVANMCEYCVDVISFILILHGSVTMAATPGSIIIITKTH